MTGREFQVLGGVCVCWLVYMCVYMKNKYKKRMFYYILETTNGKLCGLVFQIGQVTTHFFFIKDGGTLKRLNVPLKEKYMHGSVICI